MSPLDSLILSGPTDHLDLGFGKYFSAKVLRAQAAGGRWSALELDDFAKLSVHPASGAVQYAQSIFEGLKAYQGEDGVVRVFRPAYHAERFRLSAERLCMPTPSDALFLEAVHQVVAENLPTVPSGRDKSLYIRPTLYGTEAFLGVRPSQTYEFLVLASPVASYFSGKNRRSRIWVEQVETRAAPGGIGFAKAGANYAASLHAAVEAKRQGFDQVLWLGGEPKQWIEEVGTMNVFFVLEHEVVTPPLQDTLLAGCTRDTVLTLLRELGYRVLERPISLEELRLASAQGHLREVFGTGTAAVISPVGELYLGQEGVRLSLPEQNPLAETLRRTIQDIQYGASPDPNGWTSAIARSS